MTANLTALLLQLSESGEPAILWGRQAKPYFGTDLERLLNRGLIAEEARAEEWEVCDTCECDHSVRLIQEIDGRVVAACPYDQRSDTVLEPEDLRSFRITIPLLVREIANASGFAQEPTEIMPGVWHLDQRLSNRDIYLVPSITGALQPGLVAALRSVSRSLPITLLAPTLPSAAQLRFAEAEVHTVAVCDAIYSGDGSAAFAIDLAKLEPAPQFVPRLVIAREAKSVALDGAPKKLSDQAFKLLIILAEQAVKSSAVVENRRIEDRLWGPNIHKITSEVREPARALRDALAAESPNPRAVRSLIENRRNPNGYRLALNSTEILLYP